MNENVICCIVNMLLPVTMSALGIVIWRSMPPYGSILGYKTSRSLKNPILWNFDQSYFGKYCTLIYAVLSVLTLTAGLVSIFVKSDETALAIISGVAVIINVAALFIIIGLVEYRLKKIELQNGADKENTNGF